MEHCNELPITNKAESPIGKNKNGYDAKIYWNNSYDSVIGMILYLKSSTRQDSSFAVHQCARFTHNTKASHDTAVKSICWYLQGNKENGLVFNPSKKLMMNSYADAYFAGLWGHENPQDPIYGRNRTRFVVTFSNCPLLWVSKLYT